MILEGKSDISVWQRRAGWFWESRFIRRILQRRGIAQLAKSIVSEKLNNNQIVGFCPSADMISEIDTKMVAMAAVGGDPVANEIIRMAAEYLGQGLAILLTFLILNA